MAAPQISGLHFGDETLWYVTHVESDGHFYAQVSDPSVAVKYERLYQDIHNLASSGKLDMFESATTVSVGELCVAQFSEDQQWYRAQVLSVYPESNEVEVFFIDYGNSETTSIQKLLRTTQKIGELPPQAYQASLSNVEPNGGSWSDASIELLRELVLDRELTGQAEKLTKNGVLLINMYVDNTTKAKVAEQLVAAGFGHWKKSLTRSSSVSSTGSSGASRHSQSSNEANHASSSVKLQKFKVMVEEYLDLCVSHCEGPELFYCQPIKHSSDLSELLNRLNEFYSKVRADELSLKTYTAGQTCCARFSEDTNWYRGVIKDDSLVKSQRKALIQFLDFGNSELLDLSEIKELKAEYVPLPALALKCALAGVRPPKGHSNFPPESIEKFESLTIDKHLIGLVTAIDEDSKMCLILYDTTNGSEEVTIGQEMVTSGHAMPSSSIDGLQISIATSSRSSVRSQDNVTQQKYVSLAIEIGNVEKVFVAYALTPHEFYCQLSKSADSLEQLMTDLNTEYENLGPNQNKLISHVSGTPCCAVFHEDRRFYRAEVLDITGSIAKVSNKHIHLAGSYIHNS